MRRLFTSIVAIGSVLLSFAQDWQVFDMGNSPLPSTTVTALVEDGQGGIWVGTDWGLCHFDGEAGWDIFQVDDSDIPSNYISSLAMDADERLWVGTVSDGLALFDGGVWSVFTPDNSGIPGLGVKDLFIDYRGWVWIAMGSGLVCYADGNWNVYNDTEESYNGLTLNTGNTNAVAVRGDGVVCLGTFNGGLHFLTETSVSFLTTFNDGFFDNTATDVLFDPVNGDRWISTPAGGLLRQQGPVNGGNWFQWNSSIAFPSNGLLCLTMDPSRRIWTGTQISGLIRVDTDGSFVQFTELNSGLPDNEVKSVLAGSDGAVWVGTVYGGLARYQPNVGSPERPQHAVAHVYPNPVVHDRISVSGIVGPWNWTLLNAQGRLVAEGAGNGSNSEVRLQGVSSGIYIFQIRKDRLVEAHRLLVESD